MATVTGGRKVKPILAQMVARAKSARQVAVGFPADATYPDGTSVPMVAAIQEFGAPGKNIPPRPFFRTMIDEHSAEWPKLVVQSLKTADGDANKALEVTGLVIAGQLQQSIIDFSGQALSPVTVMLRGMRSQKRYRGLAFYKLMAAAVDRVNKGQTNYGASAKPLVDTGTLLNSVAVTVSE